MRLSGLEDLFLRPHNVADGVHEDVLCPFEVCGFSSALMGLRQQGTGHLRGGLTIDGLLVRDLQLQPKSRFAYFLRPLPARAGQLTLHATKFRTRMLRVVNTSAAARRCADSLLSLTQKPSLSHAL